MDIITVFSKHSDVEFYLTNASFHPLLNRFREANEQQNVLQTLIKEDVRICLALSNQKIVGYTLILKPEESERWSYLDYIKILGAVEVAPPYRNQGIAKKLLWSVCNDPKLEDYIILSIEYAWHWDLKMVNGDIELYKKLLKSFLSLGRFEETLTDEADVAMYKHNFMMSRIGKNITDDQLIQFTKLANLNSIM